MFGFLPVFGSTASLHLFNCSIMPIIMGHLRGFIFLVLYAHSADNVPLWSKFLNSIIVCLTSIASYQGSLTIIQYSKQDSLVNRVVMNVSL